MENTIPYKLEKFDTKDFELYLQLSGNAEVMAMITERPLDKQESWVNFERLLDQNMIAEDFGHFKILSADSGDFIGLAKLMLAHKEDREAEIGFMLLPKYWGKGITGKATQELIARAKSKSHIQKLKAILDPQNKASRKILVNNGFVSEYLGEIDGLPEEIMVLILSS